MLDSWILKSLAHVDGHVGRNSPSFSNQFGPFRLSHQYQFDSEPKDTYQRDRFLEMTGSHALVLYADDITPYGQARDLALDK
jgi:hypothetical protein